MHCREAQRLIGSFVEGKMPEDKLEDFLNHIEHCQNCYDELEVHYVITTGIKELDEEHHESLNFKKGLKLLIEKKREELQLARRNREHRERNRTFLMVIVFFLIMAVVEVFNYSDGRIHDFNDFSACVLEMSSEALGITVPGEAVNDGESEIEVKDEEKTESETETEKQTETQAQTPKNTSEKNGDKNE